MSPEWTRTQLALFQERKVKPRRADDSTGWMMGMLDIKDALVDVLIGGIFFAPVAIYLTLCLILKRLPAPRC
jgi:hypothetical protein